MEYRKLGTSDVTISAITLGTWAIGGWMWGGTDREDSIAAIRRAVELGVTSIDTAAVYGYGLSEEIVGEAVADFNRDEIQILTKYGLRWDSTDGEFHFTWTEPNGRKRDMYKVANKDSVVWECEQSLRRLGVDYIDLYQCHWRDNTTPVEETMEAMDKLISDGKIRAAGVSNFTVSEIDACRKAGALASNQPQYSMVRREIEKDMVPYCIENDVGLIAYSPLHKGLLTGKITEDYKFSPGDHRANDPLFAPQNVRRVNEFLNEIRPISDSHGMTLAQLVIYWTINRPGITAALVGARNPDQAEENASAAETKLSQADLDDITRILDDHKL